MKGLKTLGFNLGGAVGTAALTWAIGVDWTQYVSPSVALMIVFGANTALRIVTTTPVGKAE